MDERLVTIETSTFTACVVMLDDTCVRAPAALRWCLGKRRAELSPVFRENGWRAIIGPCPAVPVLDGREGEPD